jgi:hypothetical protein
MYLDVIIIMKRERKKERKKEDIKFDGTFLLQPFARYKSSL